MPSMFQPGARTAAKAVIAIAIAATAAFGLGALHGGAATPSTQSVAVPDKAGQSVNLSWSGTIPPASPHPTSDCNGAGVGDDDEALVVTTPRKGYDRIDATFTFKITWTPSNPTGAEDINDEVLTVNSADNGDPGDTASSEVGSSDGG